MKASTSRYLNIRGLRYHVREWGREGAPRLFLLHGWMDASVSFQFVVDALAADWHVIAPDWRGFGLSAWAGDAYWFPDYFADLDAVLDAWEPDRPARLVGHSLGGNVALMYAGIRPECVDKVVALDAFGLIERTAAEAPARYRQWLDDIRAPMAFRPYADFDALAARLQRDNRRLDPVRAAWLARHLGEDDGAGGVRLRGDPAHRRVNPVLYRRAEAEACWRGVRAPVLWIEPDPPELRRRIGIGDDLHAAARACFADLEVVSVADAGHNLHHDQPQAVARIVEAFLLSQKDREEAHA